MGSLKPTSIPGVSHSSPPPSPAGHQPPCACSLPRHTPGVPPGEGSVFESDSVGWWICPPPPARLGPGSRPGLETIPRGFLQAGFGSRCVCEWTPGGGGECQSVIPFSPASQAPSARLFSAQTGQLHGAGAQNCLSPGGGGDARPERDFHAARRRGPEQVMPRLPVLRWSRLLFPGLCLTPPPRGDCTGQFQFLVDLPGGGLASTWEILPVTGAMCQKKFRP